jgi:exodeoxyribonuclease-1
MDLDSEALAARIFTRSDELPEGQQRLPVKSVRRNRCPVLAPLKTLDAAAAERLEIDLAAAERHRRWLASHAEFGQRVAMAMTRDRELPGQDVDNDLYGGAFFSAEDRRRMEKVRATPPKELAGLKPCFDDPRLEQMLWRYRARNWPETLSREEQGAWRSFCRRRLSDPEAGAGILYAEFRRRVEALYAEADPYQADILQRLASYAGALAAELGLA